MGVRGAVLSSLSSLLAVSLALPFTPAPQVCKFASGNYSLEWRFDALSSDVVFSLRTAAPFDNFWTGVYFGEDSPNDVIGVFVRSGQIGLVDGHFGAETADGRREIESDATTNVQSLSFDVRDGELFAEFARPLAAADADDADLSTCTTFFAPVRAEEIGASGPISLPEQVEKFRVCDIASICSNGPTTVEVVKRQDAEAPVCEWTDGETAVHWKKGGQGVRFSVEAPVKTGKHWTAVGVGDSMADLKLAVVFTENGKVKQAGGYTVDGYKPPSKAKGVKVNLDKKVSKTENGKVSFEFVAPAKMFAETDDSGCLTLQMAINAGAYQGNFNIRKHENTPVPVKVCGIMKCGEEPAKGSEETSKEERAGEQEEKPAEKHETAAEEIPPQGPNPEEGSGTGAEPMERAESEGRPQDGADGASGAETALEEGSGQEKNGTSTTSKAAEGLEATKEKEADRGKGGEGAGQVAEEEPASVEEKPSTQMVNDTARLTPPPAGGNPKISVKPCGENHVDLRVCEGYFGDYLGKVEQWAQRHGETVEQQMWKACSLLAGVHHVTTMCCSTFTSTCQQFIESA